MSLMSPRALSTIRRTSERWMTDEIELREPSVFAHDDDTLREEHTPGAVVWTGKARIRPTRGPSEAAVAEGVLALRDADINLPLDAPDPYRDQEVRVVTSQDASLQNRWFRITDVRVFSQQATRQISVVQHQRSRLWPGGA